MFLPLLTILALLIGSLTGKPVIAKNISDCSISEDGILHYHGKHSFTKFDHECLSWNDLQTIYPDIINEPNFFNDESVKAAKNYCRNPSMDVHGAWCYVQNEDVITYEHCDVCRSLVPKPTTISTDIDSMDDVTTDIVTATNFFQNLQHELKRYGAYLREKFLQIMEKIRQKFRQTARSLSDHFNLYG